MAEVGQVTEYVSINLGKWLNKKYVLGIGLETRLFATNQEIIEEITDSCDVHCEIERNPPPNVVAPRMIIKGTAQEVSRAKKILTNGPPYMLEQARRANGSDDYESD